jgi:hypothetical protein
MIPSFDGIFIWNKYKSQIYFSMFNDFPVTLREAGSMPRITSSFTPLAFAPGVLKTTMPFSEHL